MTRDDLPDLDWSSEISEAMHADTALRIADEDGDNTARNFAEREALTYFYVAWLVEGERSDGRGNEPLATAGDAFLDEIRRQHDLDETAGVPMV